MIDKSNVYVLVTEVLLF